MAKKATAAAGISAEAPTSSTTKTKAASPARETKAARAIKSVATESATTKSTKTTSAASPTTPATKAAGAKAADKKAADKKTAVLLTLTDIGDHLATTFDMPKSHAKIYLAEAVTLIAKNLRKGNKVRISGLGVFEVKKRAARKGRNPSNGEPIKIKATKRVGFAVARDLKVKL